MVHYIKNNIIGNFVEFPHELNKNLYGNIGYTLEDFENGCWVKLSDEQVKFKNDNPDASAEEVFSMKLNRKINEITIDDYKKAKEAEITSYYNSIMIKQFFIDGEPMWFNKYERKTLMFRFESEKRNNEQITKIWYNGNDIILPIDTAINIIYSVELYSSKCYDNAMEHILTIKSMNDINEINEYNHKIGYPEKLRF